MHDGESPAGADNQWRIRADVRGRDVSADPAANRQLRRLRGEADGWESIGGRPCLTLDLATLGHPLPPGWYELRGHLQAREGRIMAPSVYPRYIDGSAVPSIELTLRAPDASGRFAVLLLFLDDVQSLAFYPSVTPVRFTMRGFSLHRIPRSRALRYMLAGPRRQAGEPGYAGRALAWCRRARQYGLRRATDELYADYVRRLFPHDLGDYEIWTRRYDTIGPIELAAFHQRAAALAGQGPLISVLLAADDASGPWLPRSLDSVLGQVRGDWELCIADASTAPRVREVLADYARRDPRIRMARCDAAEGATASNAALAMARGDFVALLGDAGELRPHSLLRVAEAIVADPRLVLVYSDEDRLAADGNRRAPNFKPDWNPDLLRSQDYIGHLVAIRTSLANEAGGFRGGFGSREAYDLVLRCSERIEAQQIGHIPEILYHTRMAGDAVPAPANDETSAGARAVAEHLARTGTGATIVPGDLPPGLCRVRWPVPEPAPKVSLIIPTRDRADLLKTCVESILAKSTYPDFELVVVDNQSRDAAALDYLRELGTRERVRVLRYDAPFNYSAINNWAARQCDGQLLGLVNNDIEVISPDWLEEMAGFALRPDTGAVGAMLYFPDDTIQHAGVLIGMLGLAGHIHARKPRGYTGHGNRALVAQNLSAVTGACLLVRRTAFDEVGGLDERLGVAFNDIDFCLKLRQHGYRNVWTPFAEMYHHESASRGSDDTAEKIKRFNAEIAFMQERWGDILGSDPAYNPNLSLMSHNFDLAFPPRAHAAAYEPD